jgi:hypothetical protein
MKRVVCLILLFSMLINCIPINPAKPVSGIPLETYTKVVVEPATKLELRPYEQDWKLGNVTTLVIASPTASFTTHDIDTITQFVTNGGSLIINGRKGSTSSLNPLLTKFGLQLSENNILSSKTPYDIGSFNTDRLNRTNSITRDIRSVFLNWPVAIRVNNSEAMTLIESDENTFLDLDNNNQIDPGEPKGPFPLLVTLTYGKGKVAVFSGTMHETIFGGYESWVRNLLTWFDSDKQLKLILFEETKNEQSSIYWERAQQIYQLHPEWYYYGKFKDLAISMGYILITQPNQSSTDRWERIFEEEDLLTNGQISLRFDKTHGYLDSIIEPNSGLDFISNKSSTLLTSSIFSINILGITDTQILPSHATEYYFTRWSAGDGATLKWGKFNVGSKPVNIEVLVDVTLIGTSSEWRIQIKNYDNLTFLTINFPIINGIGELGNVSTDDCLVSPAFTGALIRDFTHTIPPFQIIPSKFSCMQFMAVYSELEQTGLIYHVKDVEGFTKQIEANQYEDTNTIVLKQLYYLPLSGEPLAEISIPYTIAIQFFNGDWKTAAQLYKSWSDKQWWAVPLTEKLPSRTNVSPIQVLMSKENNEAPYEIVALSNYTASRLQRPFTVNWWGWEKNGWYNQWPDTLPPKYGWDIYRDNLEKIRSMGALSNVMIIGNYYSMNLTSWSEAKNYAVIRAKLLEVSPGVFENDSYVTGKTFQTQYALMDLSSSFFQNLLVNMTSKLMLMGGDVVWVDGVGNLFPAISFVETANHPAGGGNWWFNGTYNELQKVLIEARKTNQNTTLMVEGANELYLPVISYFFSTELTGLSTKVIINNENDTLQENVSFIPLWHMVNHEYAVPVSNPILIYPEWTTSCNATDYQQGYFTHRDFYRWALAKTIVWGEVPMLTMADGYLDHDKELVDFLNSSITTRLFLKDFLLYGRLIDVPTLSSAQINIVSPPPASDWDYMSYGGMPFPNIKDDKIQASLWENDKGQYSLLMVNVGNTTESVNIESLASKYNLSYSFTDGGQYKGLEKVDEQNLIIKPYQLIAIISKNNDDIVKVELESKGRIDVGKQGVTYMAQYAFDGKPLLGQVSLNSSLTGQRVGKVVYNVSKIVDKKYGFTRFDSNVVSTIYDRIKVISGGTSNQIATVNKPVTVWFKAQYEYDNSTFDGSSGTLYVNGLPMKWSDPGQRWERFFNSSQLEKLTFNVTRVDDTRFGLSTINVQSSPISSEWVVNVQPNEKINLLPTVVELILIILVISVVSLGVKRKLSK